MDKTYEIELEHVQRRVAGLLFFESIAAPKLRKLVSC